MFFSKISGFDPSNLMKLPASERWKLEIFSLWGVLGIGGCAAAAAYLFFITTRSYALAAAAAATVLVCFFSVQGVLNSNRGLPLGSTGEETKPLSGKQFHIAVYLLLTLAFTQPILIFASKLLDQPKINELNRLEIQLRTQGLVDAHASGQAQRQRELAKIREKINTLGGHLSFYISNEEMALLESVPPPQNAASPAAPAMNLASAARKALVIGNNAYADSPLQGPIRDAKGMKSKLEKMGFSVTLLTDATRLTMERQMVDYVNSLNPGDISFFYFSGHGTQHHGVNYLVPVDAAPQLNDFVSINKLMQMQRDKSILASIIMTDACRKGTLYETGFDSTGSSRNTYIALAAAAGEESIDGIPNGVFTTRVLKHITAEKDIDTIFNTIKAEMARDPSVKQHPTSINFLEEPIVLAVQTTPPRPTALNSSVATAPHYNQAGRNNQCIHTRMSSDPDFDRQGLLNQCIGEFLKIKDDVVEDRQMAAQAQSQLAEQLKLRFSDDQFNPIYFFNYLWSSQVVNLPESGLSNTKPIYRSALLTLLIWFILAGGLIYREHLDEAQNAYREFRVDEENHQLHVIYQKYSLLADEAMQKFKDKLRQAITSPTLLKPDLATHLPNPFAEDEDVANRKNTSYLTEQKAIDHLKKVLGST